MKLLKTFLTCLAISHVSLSYGMDLREEEKHQPHHAQKKSHICQPIEISYWTEQINKLEDSRKEWEERAYGVGIARSRAWVSFLTCSYVVLSEFYKDYPNIVMALQILRWGSLAYIFCVSGDVASNEKIRTIDSKIKDIRMEIKEHFKLKK